jgi:hypothetical protein
MGVSAKAESLVLWVESMASIPYGLLVHVPIVVRCCAFAMRNVLDLQFVSENMVRYAVCNMDERPRLRILIRKRCRVVCRRQHHGRVKALT